MNAIKATSGTSSGGGGTPSLPASAVWDILSQDSGAGLMVCDTAGKLVAANDRFARMVNQPSADTVQGRTLHDIYPEPAARERLDVIRRAIRERKSLVVESVWNGIAFQSIVRPLVNLGGDPEQAVVVVRHQPKRGEDDAPREMERVILRSNNLGPLSRLTVRELELLALIGEGLSSQDIAKKISRSIKTVEAHRASLGKKLGVTSRVALAKIAAESNLHYDMLQARQVVGGRLASRHEGQPANGN